MSTVNDSDSDVGGGGSTFQVESDILDSGGNLSRNADSSGENKEPTRKDDNGHMNECFICDDGGGESP